MKKDSHSRYFDMPNGKASKSCSVMETWDRKKTDCTRLKAAVGV